MNILLSRIIEVIRRYSKNFLIQDLSDESIAVIGGEVTQCEITLLLQGVVMSKECMNELNADVQFHEYLTSNNWTWLMSCDPEAHYSVIYVINKDN